MQKNKQMAVSIEPKFDTESRYAIIAGWLLLPAIGVFFSLLASLVLIIYADPTAYPFDYYFNALYFVFYLFILYFWVKRKKVLPTLMIINYISNIIFGLFIIYQSEMQEVNWLNILFNFIWIGYFLKSERVKATFTNSIN